jgi:D-inositol-3-phosphate glycosyltransferase
MATRLSIYHPMGRLKLQANPFGKDVANLQLFRALAEHGGFADVDILSFKAVSAQDLREDFGATAGSRANLHSGVILNQNIPAAAGALLRGQPYIDDLAWLRRRGVGDRAYSLLGLVHTLASVTIREMIAMAAVAPVQPWDAFICTSPSVQSALAEMLGDWGEHLAERTGGAAPPQPMLPIVPLGVDGPGMAALADRPKVRGAIRERLGVADDHILVLWVGRLSYFEKAYPQVMFRAAQQGAKATGSRVHFAMSGWFPRDQDEGYFREAAQAHAPDVTVQFLDGNDRSQLGELWAGADIFLSLVDNIQETFGITPIEAMAAGLPVVASDWNGYRSTVRDGIDGLLVPTLGSSPSPLGDSLALRTALEMDPYQAYVGGVAQHTAVHVGRAAQALATLIRQPDLRRRMGAAGRARIAADFDWPVVARKFHALVDELAAVRAAAPAAPASRHRMNPVKTDPFAAFRGFPTQVIGPDTALSVPSGITEQDVRRTQAVRLDNAFSQWRGTFEEALQAFTLVQEGRAATVRDVLMAVPQGRRLPVQHSLVWLAKHGLLDWLGD